MFGAGRWLLTGATVGLLICIGVEDARTGHIYNRRSLLLLCMGMADCLLRIPPAFSDRLAGTFSMSGILLLISVLSGGGIGGGDIKLTAAAGFLLGVKAVTAGTCGGMILAGMYAFFLVVSGRGDRKREFALGPFLCLAYCMILVLRCLSF